MAVTFHAYPYRDYETTEAEYSRLLDAALGGSGLLEAVSYSISGMTLTMGAIDGVIRGHRFVSPGGTIGVESSTAARTALVFAKLDYSGTPIVSAGVKYGTGSAVPALTQTPEGVYEIPLWSIAVPANASSLASGNVTDRWTRLRSPSQALVYVQAERPANPPVGSLRIW
ncbi:hypothetical protein [Leucobacter sp.]